MNLKFLLATVPMLAGLALTTPAARAETLATQATHQHRGAHAMAAPRRGMSMAQVERRFGAPLEKLPPAGGDAPRHPVINRWRYAGYTVYFERNRVIHSVLDTDAAAPNS